MKIKTEQVLNALRKVQDPDLKKDLVTLGMIRDIEVRGLKIRFTVVLTTPACPLKEKIRQDCINAVHTEVHPGAEVEINMTAEVTSQIQTPELNTVRNIIGVVSGKGGVGKSTVAANLAVALARTGARVALVDGDIYGPSIPIMFGVQQERPVVEVIDGKEMMIPVKKYGVSLISIGFLVPPDQAVVWRGPMASKAMSQLIFDVAWGPIDYLVLDMPPGTGDLHLTMVQKLPVTGIVLVTTPQEVALADARKGAQMFQNPQINIPVLGVVENMAWFSPPELPDRKYYLFGKDGGKQLAASLGIPLLGQIPIVEQIREQGDAGTPPAAREESPLESAFGSLAAEVARQVAIRNTNQPPGKKVEVVYQ